MGKAVYIECGTIHGFKHLLGGLGMDLLWMREETTVCDYLMKSVPI